MLSLKFFFIFGSTVFYGAVAQLGERLHGMQEVDGSIPFSSTIPELSPPNCPKSVMGRVVWAVRKPSFLQYGSLSAKTSLIPISIHRMSISTVML